MDCSQAGRKRMLDLARRIAKGETITATPEERQAAQDLIDCNKAIWEILEGVCGIRKGK